MPWGGFGFLVAVNTIVPLAPQLWRSCTRNNTMRMAINHYLIYPPLFVYCCASRAAHRDCDPWRPERGWRWVGATARDCKCDLARRCYIAATHC